MRHSRVAARLPRPLARLVRRNDGVAAVEFALVATPFFALLFAIIETALVFFGGQVLETATQDASRLLVTGQAQTGQVPMDAAKFRTYIADRSGNLFTASALKIDVRKVDSFGGMSSFGKPGVDSQGQLDTAGWAYTSPKAGEKVLVRVAYEWPIVVRSFGLDLADLPNGKRLIMSSVAFQVEPFQ